MIYNNYISKNGFLSYEIGVMIAVTENHPTNCDMYDRIKTICKVLDLNLEAVEDGIKDYMEEYHYEYTEEEIHDLMNEFGIIKK